MFPNKDQYHNCYFLLEDLLLRQVHQNVLAIVGKLFLERQLSQHLFLPQVVQDQPSQSHSSDIPPVREHKLLGISKCVLKKGVYIFSSSLHNVKTLSKYVKH